MIHRFVKTQAALLVVDIQERLAMAMPADALKRLVVRTMAAVDSAKALGMPIIVTEQYPKGLGPTLKPIADKVPAFSPIEKLEFSAFTDRVREELTGISQVLITGIEAHVCVFQTCRALSDAGLTAFVAVDAVLSRHEIDLKIGLELCQQSGAQLTTVEAAFFDAMVRAGGPQFKAISAAVK